MLVLWTVALACLMGCVAMAVELGNLAQSRQHAENAVQAAVLAAVPDLATLYPGGPGVAATQEQLAVNDAESYLMSNFSSLTTADFATGCAGVLPSSIYIWPGADCFGFFNPQTASLDQSNPNAMAIALPVQFVKYSFGRAVGQSGQSVSGLAYASIKMAESGGGLPFSYVNTAPDGLECLKSGSGNKAGVCKGFTTGSGDFGAVNSPRYRIFPGASNAGGNNPVTETNLVLGIDHALNIAPSSDPTVQICDSNGAPPSCTAYNDSLATYDLANWVSPQTGQTQTDITPPLFTGGVTTPDGSCTLTPRLNHPDGFVGTSSCSADDPTTGPSAPYLSASHGDTYGSTYLLNGVHISKYLNATGQQDASSCTPLLPAGVNASNSAIDATGTGGTNVWSAYDTCFSTVLQNLDDNTAIFSATIEQSPRFGIVPLVTPTNGTNAEQITDFEGVYIDLTSGTSSKVSSILAWVFPLSNIEATPGSGSGSTSYVGGPYVVNLCSLSAGNC